MERVTNCCHSDSIHEIVSRKKISRPLVLEEMKKYYVFKLLVYQSIHDKYEPAHEIFILIAYTLSHPLHTHAQLSSGVKSVNFG